ncbi:MAG: ATP-binding protein, partial [Myxococcota bacterium]
WNPAVTRLFPGLPLAHDLEVFPALGRRLRHPGDEKPVGDAVGLERAFQDPNQPEAGHLFQLHRQVQENREDAPWLRISATSIPSRRGEIVAYSLRFVDITAQRRGELQRRTLEAQIQHVEKLRSLGVLAGGIAHDFNNRLTVILGNASLALEDLSPSDPLHESVKEIEEVAQNAAELTQQLLAYSGRSQFAVEPVNVSELVRTMTPLLEQSVSPKVSLIQRLEDDLPSIEADPTQLRRVLQNLVANASESMGAHSGEVVVRTAWLEQTAHPPLRDPYEQKVTPGPHILLEVSDNGCGMDEDARKRIFDPFFSTRFNGRVLGLAAAYGIVRAHGGVILVESQLGRGSSVTVLLPVATAAPTALAKSAVARAPNQLDWHATGVVLVVDDEAPVRRVAALILRRTGFEVLVADSGREAIRLMRAHTDEIRLVLLDLSMSGTNGEKMLREIRSIDRDVPVLLSSGYDETDAMSSIRSNARLRFVHKPYGADELISCVRDMLGD